MALVESLSGESVEGGGRKPPWLRVKLPSDPTFWSTKAMVSDLKLHTVCEEAQCPNRWECWEQGTATS